MRKTTVFIMLCLFGLLASQWLSAQEVNQLVRRGELRAVGAEPTTPGGGGTTLGTAPDLSVFSVMKFAGTLKDSSGEPRTGAVGITFAFYSEQTGGAPLWLETQNIQLDSQGGYTALLGATKAEGLPINLFASGEARWLGIQVGTEAELQRILLVSVPYALKAAEAETLGGRSADEFVLNEELEKQVQQAVETQVAESEINLAIPGGTKEIAEVASTFTDNNSTEVVLVTQSGTGRGLRATSTSGTALEGTSTATTGATIGVLGLNSSTGGKGLFGVATAATGVTAGLQGQVNSPQGTGVVGLALASTGLSLGVKGETQSTSGTGVGAIATATTGNTIGLNAEVRSAAGTAALINNTAGGKLLSGLSTGGSEVFSVAGDGSITSSGTVTATTFSGAFSGTATDASDVNCANCVDASDVAADVATQAELDAHAVGNPAAHHPKTIDASELIIGTVDDARLTLNVPRKNTVNTFIQQQAMIANTTDQVLNVVQQGTGAGLRATATSGQALEGTSTATTGVTIGVLGLNSSTGGKGLFGVATAATGVTVGLQGQVNSPQGTGVYGRSLSLTGRNFGVRGETLSDDGQGVVGHAKSLTGVTFGVVGLSDSVSGRGLQGVATATTGTTVGLQGQVNSTAGVAIASIALATTGNTIGLNAEVRSAAGTAALFSNTAGGKLVSGISTGGAEVFAVDGSGNVTASGNVTSSGIFTGDGGGLTNIPGATGGTVTSVASGTGLTGGPVTTTGTLSIDTAVVPQLGAANTFTVGTQLVQTGAAATKGLVVQGAFGQTATLQEWQDDAGTAVASVAADGTVTAAFFIGDGSGITGIPGGGTVTSVGSGTGLTGGPVTTTGTLSIDTTVVPRLGAINNFTANQNVTGTVTATAFVGDGSGLTGIPGGGTVTSVGSGTGLTGGPVTTIGTLSIDTTVVPQLGAINNFTANQNVTGTVTATAFTGDGTGLTGIGTLTNVATGLGIVGGPITTTGTVSIDTTVVPRLNAINNFTANINVIGTVGATAFIGNGSGLTGVTSTASDLVCTTCVNDGDVADMAWGKLTGVPAGFADGTDADSGGTVTSVASGTGLTGGPVTTTGTLSIDTTVVPQLGAINNFTANINVIGTVAATAFTGDGSGLTGVTSTASDIVCVTCVNDSDVADVAWGKLTGVPAGFADGVDADSGGTVTSVASGTGLTGGPVATTGTLSIDTTVVPQLNAVNNYGASQNVTGTVTATAFVGDGSGLTNLPSGAGSVTSVATGLGLTGGPITTAGTVSIDTTVVPQLGAANTFTTGTQLVQTGATGTVGLAVQGAAGQLANLQEWQDSTGTAVASVAADGTLDIPSADIKIRGAGSGIFMVSPDGTKCGLVFLANNSKLTVTIITCPIP